MGRLNHGDCICERTAKGLSGGKQRREERNDEAVFSWQQVDHDGHDGQRDNNLSVFQILTFLLTKDLPWADNYDEDVS